MKSSVFKKHFHWNRGKNFTTDKGGNEWILINNKRKSGLYIVWCHVTPPGGKKEFHAFVYDSDFDLWDSKVCYGAIIDNRPKSFFRALEEKDVVDVQTVRQFFHKYF